MTLSLGAFMDWGLTVFILIAGSWMAYVVILGIYNSVRNYFNKPLTIREAIALKNQNDYWYQLKLQAFNTYGRVCSRCGSTVNLHVHHKIPLSEGGSNQIDNLLILCYKCHRGIHGKVIDYNNQNDGLYQQVSGFKLPSLISALENKSDVTIEYQKTNGVTTIRRLTPLSIFKDQNHFYLKAYCHLRGEERTFRVSRIKRII